MSNRSHGGGGGGGGRFDSVILRVDSCDTKSVAINLSPCYWSGVINAPPPHEEDGNMKRKRIDEHESVDLNLTVLAPILLRLLSADSSSSSSSFIKHS